MSQKHTHPEDLVQSPLGKLPTPLEEAIKQTQQLNPLALEQQRAAGVNVPPGQLGDQGLGGDQGGFLSSLAGFLKDPRLRAAISGFGAGFVGQGPQFLQLQQQKAQSELDREAAVREEERDKQQAQFQQDIDTKVQARLGRTETRDIAATFRTNERTRAQDFSLGGGTYEEFLAAGVDPTKTKRVVNKAVFNRFKREAEQGTATRVRETRVGELDIEGMEQDIRSADITGAITGAGRIAEGALGLGVGIDISDFSERTRELLGDREIMGIVERVFQGKETEELEQDLLKSQAENQRALAARQGEVRIPPGKLDELTKLGVSIDEFKRISKMFNPAFVGIPQSFKALAQKFIPGAQIFSAKEEDFRAAVLTNLAEMINDMAGAALSPEEAARYIAGLPELGDKPVKFQQELKNVIRKLEFSLKARSKAFNQNPSQFVSGPLQGETVQADILSGDLTEEEKRALNLSF